MSENTPPPKNSLAELAGLCLRLGFTAFGGPAAHIAMLEQEVVEKREWLSHEEFLDLLGITNLIPGPNSTEMVIHVGHRRCGALGMWVAGLAFILPAAFIVCICAWLYVRFGSLPQAEGILLGVKPVVLIIILQAFWMLWKKAAKTKALGILGILMGLVAFLGIGELEVLIFAGAVMAFAAGYKAGPKTHAKGLTTVVLGSSAILALIIFGTGWQATGENPYSEWALFAFFAKVGSILYGSGYVLLAFIESGLVDQWQWITQDQLVDAVAVGQVTPGPLFTTATFIGFLMSGPKGALIATIGIFLPAFIFVGISGRILPYIRQSMWAGAFLDGVNAASLGLMAVVTAQLGISGLRDPFTIILALMSAVFIFKFKINNTWLIAGGAVLGLAYSMVF